MGKRQHKKKKRRVRSERHQRGSGHVSGPEEQTGGSGRESCSPAWNSLDEESLADYAENVAESGEEVEVAKLLSFLNFSVIPCALEPCNLEWGVSGTTDVDLLSELNSTGTQERGERGEGEERERRRGSRKRASRRRPNKRAKKLRGAAAADSLCLCQFVRARGERAGRRGGEEEGEGERLAGSSMAASPLGTAGETELSSYRLCERCRWVGEGVMAPAERRGKTKRRSKGERFDPMAGPGRLGGRENRSESTTPVNLPTRAMAQQVLVEMECEHGTTDTSAAGEVEMGAEPEDSDHTPPADPPLGDPYKGERDYESDLSETTTDSGCDGDDEESSVERVSSALPGWWEREPPFVSSNEDSDNDHEKITSVLNGAFPLISGPETSSKPRSLRERLEISEFKHPGKVGVRGSVKKKRSKPSCGNLTPAEVNSKIASFVQDPTERELRFSLVSRAHCRTIAHLATAYRLHCEVEQARRRLPVATPNLKKTVFTRLASWEEVEPILRTHNSGAHVLPFAGSRNSTMEVSPEGGVVGGEVPVIDESNVGNRMLQGMGWRPGMGLGPGGDGIREPIHAYIRPRRSGLGF